VKRVLAGSLLGRGAGTSRIFGTRLELVELYLDTGVPYVVHRLCSYIEANAFQSAAVFRLSGGNPRLAERLRATFERRGDADLEAAGCPPTAATLLRQYLKELPQPVVPSTLVGRLLDVHTRKSIPIKFISRIPLVFQDIENLFVCRSSDPLQIERPDIIARCVKRAILTVRLTDI
jgi:hypothetical protein